jgi:putative glycosyl hydrolase
VRRQLIVVLLATAGLAAAPSVPAAATSISFKRGVASARFLSSDPALLEHVHPAWAYDWSWQTPAQVPGIEWVPMVWGAGSVTSTSIRVLTADRRSGRARFLLGFNEPDSGSQANMTPEQAAALWPRLESTGLRLGSPAPAVPGDGWLSRFMAIARTRRLRVDFIALHFYQDFTDPQAVDELRSQLISIHGRYGKPLWITEIGAVDVRAWGEHMHSPPSGPLASSYLERLLPMLDGLGFVQRYAWFTDFCASAPGCPYSALLHRSGTTTRLGRLYSLQS